MTATSEIVSITLFTIFILFSIQTSPVQSISCYTCVDCGDPFNANSSNVTQSLSSCYYCYKLTVNMAFVPTRYVVKECVQTCTETSGIFGGSSLEVNCCTSSLCNNALSIHDQYKWKNRFFLTIISNLFVVVFIHNIRQ